MARPRLLLLVLMLWVAAPWVTPPPVFAENAPEADEPTWPEHNPEAQPPSEQPEKGPGGREYAHAEVRVTERGEGALRYWLYTPAEPQPESAPVAVFLHGFGQLTPENYVGWLNHVCRRGHIVIYPQFQANGLEPTENYAPNSAKAVLDAFEWLGADNSRVQPEREKFALWGHSAGGITAANMAADWEGLKLPRPRVLMPVQPGRAFSPSPQAQARGLIPLSDYAKIPEGCLLLSVYGDSDHVVGSWTAKKIFKDATAVKAGDKNLVEFISCDYGAQALIASHYTPPAGRDDSDHWHWFGYWKLFDGLCDAAFQGKHREYALGDTPRQRFMGAYSDGRPVTELRVTLGDAEVNPDEPYRVAFDRRGRKIARAVSAE
jgi:acetyl esterase/lipase